jgi:Mpv17 / PMP22 family
LSRARSPLALGWEAARANLLPALFIQALMLALLIAYYTSAGARGALSAFADYKLRHGLTFVIIASILAGSLLPELFLIAFFQRGRPAARNLRNLLFTMPIWALDGALVDLLYRNEAAWFGNVVTVPVVAAKVFVDQFGYNPFFAAPFGVLTYEWKNEGFTWESLGRSLRWEHYRDKIVPTLCATWAVWIPMTAIIYSLPLALQFPLFSLALVFWVLLLTYMTNAFATKNSRAASRSEVVSSPIAEIAP